LAAGKSAFVHNREQDMRISICHADIDMSAAVTALLLPRLGGNPPPGLGRLPAAFTAELHRSVQRQAE